MYTIRIGGEGNDRVIETYVDGQDNTYILGKTDSDNFPQTIGHEPFGMQDIFLLKIDPFANIVWSTLFGGSADDHPSDLFVDENGFVYISGHTYSEDLAAARNEKREKGLDIFVAKFSNTGDLLWSTYFGTKKKDISTGIAVVDHKIVVSGYQSFETTKIGSRGKRFPPDEQFSVYSFKTSEGVVVWFSETGDYLQNQTFGQDSVIEDMEVNSELYLAGYTNQPLWKEADTIFIMALTSEGELRWKQTFLQEEVYEASHNIKLTIDKEGEIYLQDKLTWGAKLNRQGEVIWQKIWQKNFTDALRSFTDFEIKGSMLFSLGISTDEIPRIKDSVQIVEKRKIWPAIIAQNLDGNVTYSSPIQIKTSEKLFAGYFDEEYWSFVYSSTKMQEIKKDHGSGGDEDIYWTFFPNPLQDTDDDGIPNYFELKFNLDPFYDDADFDPDQDGLTNIDEFHYGTNPNLADTDGDQIPDKWEIENGISPTVADEDKDPDGDGLTNLQEYNFQTDPQSWDTDDDGMSDKWEVMNKLNPLVDDSKEDPDQDGLNNKEEFVYGTNPQNNDTDRDGMPDGWEVKHGLDPFFNDASVDLDGDGLSNRKEYDFRLNPKSRLDIVVIIIAVFLPIVWGLGRKTRKRGKKRKNVHSRIVTWPKGE